LFFPVSEIDLMTRSLLLVVLIASASLAEEPAKNTPADRLKPFNLLIGKWNGAGVPDGPPDKRQSEHWQETLEWGWRFKGEDAWLTLAIDKGKYFKSGELRPAAQAGAYELKLETTAGESRLYQGVFKERYLIVERTDEKTKETDKLTFALLHHNRVTYTHEFKPAGKTFFTKLYRVGATKDGEPFVEVGFNEKECVVSGGQGTAAVMFKGKTYYVCCSGCRDAFNDSPEKYVVEFEKKRAAFNKK
jgi:hypothetical protein